jgi:L-fucose isomerase-like protein
LTAAIRVMPAAVLDAWLLEKFPGKALEELDGIDFARYWRALAVQNMRAIERLRDLQQQDKYQPTPGEWRQILRHDALVADD